MKEDAVSKLQQILNIIITWKSNSNREYEEVKALLNFIRDTLIEYAKKDTEKDVKKDDT